MSITPAKITGDELHVRVFYMNYFLERYPNKDFPFTSEQLQLIEDLIYFVFDELAFSLSVSQFDRLKLFSLVSLTRIKYQHQLKLPTNIRSELSTITQKLLDDHDRMDKLMRAFNITFTDNVFLEMFFPFLSSELLLSPSDLHFNLINIKDAKLTAIKKFLNDLSKMFAITLDTPNELIFSLYNLDLFFIEHNYIFFNRKKVFMDMISNEFPHYMAHFESYIKHSMVYDYPIQSKDLEIEIMHLLLTHWPNLIENLTVNMKKTTIGVFGELDYHHSLFLAHTIAYLFNQHVIVSVIDASSIKNAVVLSKKYDLVVTNYTAIDWLSEHSLTINLAPSLTDINNLKKLIFDLTAQKNLGFVPKK